MKIWIRENIKTIAWLLGSFVTLTAILAWASTVLVDRFFDFFNTGDKILYDLFPLFGILAFSLMWTHYILYALRIYSDYDKKILKKYQKITELMVLVSILLHPGLIITQLYIDGFGLPPASYKSFVGASGVGFVLLGTIAWCAFILYEFKNKYQKYNWWKYVSLANVFAMLLILRHSIKLGTIVNDGWYSIIWTLYSISLVATYIYLIYKKKLI